MPDDRSRGRAGDELRQAVSQALKRAIADGSELGPAVEAAARDWVRRYQPVNVHVQFLGVCGEPGRIGRLRIRFEAVPVCGETTVAVETTDRQAVDVE